MDPIVERDLNEIGLHKIIGVDEAGRGSLIGPVVASSVMLPANHKIEGINDSKLVSPNKRKEIAGLIFERALEVRVSFIMNGVIDKINILNATKLAIKETLVAFRIRPDIVVIDGLFSFKDEYMLPYAYQLLPKGDTLSENIAAASIIAKTTRDAWVVQVSDQYPEYNFAQHKGYGTEAHFDALVKYGPCPIHRRSFSLKGKRLGDF